MAKKVEFYTITVYENGEKTDYSIMKLFENIESEIFDKKNKADKTRTLDGSKIRIFSYYRTMGKSQVVIPFGKEKIGKPDNSQIPDSFPDNFLVCGKYLQNLNRAQGCRYKE